MTQEELNAIIEGTRQGMILCNKTMLTTDEAAEYMGISIHTMYKLSSNMSVPTYKPGGKMCYFKREELDEWMQRNRHASIDDIEGEAVLRCMDKNKSEELRLQMLCSSRKKRRGGERCQTK